MKYVLLLLFLLLFTVSGFSQKNSKVVVGITLNNFYPGWIDNFSYLFTQKGFNRLIQEGEKYLASYDYYYSQTGVDHATIYTGTLPGEHGIVGHDWYDRLRNRRVNNVSNTDYTETGNGSDTLIGYGPEKLEALTLGCFMKMHNSLSKVYSIGLNPEESVLSAGTCADLALWFNETSAKWVSSGFYVPALPEWLQSFNDGLEVDYYIRRGWMPLAMEEKDSKNTLWRNNRQRTDDVFFYDLSRAKRMYNTYKIIKASPFVNHMTTDLAMELIKNERLGKDNDPDLLMISYSALDYMNYEYPVTAFEFQDLVQRLDRDLEKLFSFLDEQVGEGEYTVFLTYTEARQLLPVDLKKMRSSGDYFSIFKAVALLKSYLNLIYGEGEWILDYDAAQIYLNRQLIDQRGMSLKDFQDRIAEFIIEFEGVAKTITANTLTHHTLSSGKEAWIQNGFSPKKNGDILFYLLPLWSPQQEEKEDFYFRYSSCNQVPLYFYGNGVLKGGRGNCQMTDIVPRVMKILKSQFN